MTRKGLLTYIIAYLRIKSFFLLLFVQNSYLGGYKMKKFISVLASIVLCHQSTLWASDSYYNDDSADEECSGVEAGHDNDITNNNNVNSERDRTCHNSIGSNTSVWTFENSNALLSKLSDPNTQHKCLLSLGLPATFILDVFHATGQGVSVTCEHIKAHCQAVEQTARQEWIKDKVLQGYKQRIETIENSCTNQKFSCQQMLVLVFALTAWDSQDCQPDTLKLGTGEILSRADIEKSGNGNWLALYDHVSLASAFFKKINASAHTDILRAIANHDNDTSQQSNHFHSFDTNRCLTKAIDELNQAAQIAQRNVLELIK
jgi:hypothetical protein